MKWRYLYFIIKPKAQLVFSNALLEGGMFSDNSLEKNGKKLRVRSYNDLHHFVYSINFGAVVTSGHFSISFIQNSATPMLKGTCSHEVGNISPYFSWQKK